MKYIQDIESGQTNNSMFKFMFHLFQTIHLLWTLDILWFIIFLNIIWFILQFMDTRAFDSCNKVNVYKDFKKTKFRTADIYLN